MARNEEKARTELGRLYAAKQEKQQTDRSYIPPLGSLEHAWQVKKYIPKIRYEISFCLRQISGRKRFRDHKIDEFKERLDTLKMQYKSFYRKAIQLDPNMVSTPGKRHAYVPKRKVEEMKERRRLALEQNPNGFRHLYGTNDLDTVSTAKPLGWEHIQEAEEAAEAEAEAQRATKGEVEEERWTGAGGAGDGDEEVESEEAVDQFLSDIVYSDDEQEAAKDPDYIATPLMKQFKKQRVEAEKKANSTGLMALMGYGSSDDES